VIEVEAKYPVDSLSRFESALVAEHDGRFLREVAQTDTYFCHPTRDFRATDEALRIRESDEGVVLCYKGPRLDTVTKTRAEHECQIAESASAMQTILEALGFRQCGVVTKHRRIFALPAEQSVTLSIDSVEQLGQFVEIELLCEEAERQQNTKQLLEIASVLGLTHSERRSYLELLREQGDRESSPAGGQ
jgi:adenylate cyclase class 2